MSVSGALHILRCHSVRGVRIFGTIWFDLMRVPLRLALQTVIDVGHGSFEGSLGVKGLVDDCAPSQWSELFEISVFIMGFAVKESPTGKKSIENSVK